MTWSSASASGASWGRDFPVWSPTLASGISLPLSTSGEVLPGLQIWNRYALVRSRAS